MLTGSPSQILDAILAEVGKGDYEGIKALMLISPLTLEQKLRIIHEYIEPAERYRALLRMGSKTRYNEVMEGTTGKYQRKLKKLRSAGESAKTREILGEILDMAGRTYSTAIRVLITADQLRSTDPARAKEALRLLNTKGVHSGYRYLFLVDEQVTDEAIEAQVESEPSNQVQG